MKKIILSLFMIGLLSACSSETSNDKIEEAQAGKSAGEVNIYSARKGYLLKPLLNQFEEDTKIMRDNPIFQKWEKVHEHMFMPLENRTKDEGWIELEEVFRKE